MNKFYVLFPTFLLIVFSVYYTQVAKPQMEKTEAEAKQKVLEQEKIDEANRLAIEKKAQEEVRRQQAERERKDREKEEAVRREQERQDNEVRQETARLEGEAASLTKQISDEQKLIGNLRSQREALNREVFDDAAKVELAKIERRNAELEIQRMYAMVAEKVDDSFLTQMPPPAPK